MEIKVEKKKLIEALNSVGRIANAKAVVPITQNVKISIRQDGTMVVAACDMELSAMRKFQIADSFEAPFEFCINPRDFASVLKSLRDVDVIFEVEENLCVIKHSKGQTTLPTFDAELFPAMETEKDVTKATLNAELLFEWLKNAIRFVSDDDYRPIMKGVYIYIKNGEVGVCATDTRVMFTDYTTNEEYSDIDVNATLYTKAVAPLLDMINSEEKVVVYFGEQKLAFRTETSMLSCAKIVGRFPDFKRIIRKDSPIKVNVDKSEFMDSLSRATLTADTGTSLTKLKVDGYMLGIDSEDLMTSKKSHEEIVCECSGGDIAIGVNGTQLAECLKVIEADKLVFELQDTSMAINIFDSESPNKAVVVMPMCITH